LSKVFLALCGVCTIAIGALWLAGQSELIGAAATAALAALALAAAASRFRGSAFTLWVFAFVACAISYPGLFVFDIQTPGGSRLESRQVIFPLVQLVMLGMGMTLTLDDFARVARMPRAVAIGVVLQYTIMPTMGWTAARLVGLEPEVALGLILIGSCPGGVASNVMAFIARANVALSVTMTACSTLISPLATPWAVQLLAGKNFEIDTTRMMIDILKMIVLPIAVGLLANRYAQRFVQRLLRVLPALSMAAICTIIGITVADARDQLFTVGLALFGASAGHNAAGYLLGYWLARGLGLDRRDSRTVALEVGLQNGGMATGLAYSVFQSKIVALASAVFGPWSAVSSSVLASYWRSRATGDESGAA
jgi:BASS family bile acid:Na+ symporter